MTFFDAEVIDLNGTHVRFTSLDRVSFVNNESFGPGSQIGKVDSDSLPNERVLVLNVNGFAAVQFTTKEDE